MGNTYAVGALSGVVSSGTGYQVIGSFYVGGLYTNSAIMDVVFMGHGLAGSSIAVRYRVSGLQNNTGVTLGSVSDGGNAWQGESKAILRSPGSSWAMTTMIDNANPSYSSGGIFNFVNPGSPFVIFAEAATNGSTIGGVGFDYFQVYVRPGY